jgi:tRNA dimethylallyltransferase
MDLLKKHPPGLVVICGATATGKSALALALAQIWQTVILTADSRQIYREFNIGTAKPSRAEQALVRHELLDLCDPTTTFTLADYQDRAQTLIGYYHQQGITPLLVGGTGLYIQAITEGLIIPRVSPQPVLRAQLASLGQYQAYQWLEQVDPASASRIHANDQTRTLRALEVYYVTGKPLSQQQGRCPPPYPILQIGLESQDLTARIQTRTEQMLDQGWLAEVAQLVSRYGPNLPLLQTLGYRELLQYRQGDYVLSEAINQIVLRTRQFAKRQRTWFRAQPQIEWLDADNTIVSEKVAKWVEAQWPGCG